MDVRMVSSLGTSSSATNTPMSGHGLRLLEVEAGAEVVWRDEEVVGALGPLFQYGFSFIYVFHKSLLAGGRVYIFVGFEFFERDQKRKMD